MFLRYRFTVALFLSFFFSAFCGAQVKDPLKEGIYDVPLDDVSLHYVVRGHGPVLFVVSPGWGIGSMYLQHGLYPLEETFTVVYIDTRGSGGSSRPADATHMSHTIMAGDIDNLRKHLGFERIALFGHSDAGALALEFAERYPEHAEKIILADAWIMGDDGHDETAAFLNLWKDDPHYKEAALAALKHDGDSATEESFKRRLMKIFPLYFGDPDRYVPAFEKMMAGTRLSPYAYLNQHRAIALEKRDQTKDLGKVTAKTLVLNGTVDWICPYQPAQRAAAAIPHAKLSLYANKGHFLWIEDPDRFFRETTAFLLEK